MGSVDNCYSTGGVTGITDIGGLVGYNNGRVSNSYSGCNVSGNWNVGGLVGTEWTHGLVTSCYSAGSVIGHTAVGGLLGQSYVSTVMYCYCTGNVMGDLFTGGLVGQTTRSVGQTARSGVVGTPINSFWDMQTSETEASDGGTGKTTAEMKSIVTFSRAGWNIVAVANPSTRNPAYIWNIVDGQTYPFLSWQS